MQQNITFLGLVEMSFKLVHASYSLSELVSSKTDFLCTLGGKYGIEISPFPLAMQGT